MNDVNEDATPIPEAIEFAGFALRPFRYSENTEEGGLAVALQATLTAEETERLRGLQADEGRSYWPVIRRGIEAEPIEMRFGRIIWQPRDDGAIDHEITLVSKTYDESQSDAPFVGLAGEPERFHLVRIVSRLSAQIDALLTGIESGAPIDSELARGIREAGERGERTGKFVFYEVNNLADWWLE